MKYGNVENEKYFLIKSLNDLDDELAKGDISQKDYLQLTRRYKRRLITLNIRKPSSSQKPKLQNATKTWLTVAFLVAVAVVSGLAIANFSGERSASETLTGSIRKSTVTKLQEVQQLLSDSKTWPQAIEIYEEVLEDQPSNVEAITYRAWLSYRQGAASEPLIEEWNEVRLLNPEFADAIVFLTIALSDEDRFPEALSQLKELNEIEVAPQLQSVLDSQGLIGKVYAEAKYDLLQESNQPRLGLLEMDIDIALESANYLLQSDKPQRSVSVLKLFRAVLYEEPSNPEALSREALLLAQTGDGALFERAINQINFAVNENPNNIEALLTRALLLSGSDSQIACGDLNLLSELLQIEGNGAATQVVEQVDNLSLTLACEE